MVSSSKKIVNKLCSSRPAAVKTKTVEASINLRVVSRFYKNRRVQDGNQRTAAQKYHRGRHYVVQCTLSRKSSISEKSERDFLRASEKNILESLRGLDVIVHSLTVIRLGMVLQGIITF